MGWDLTGSCAEACFCQLLRTNVLISVEGRTGPSTAMFSWVTCP
jgi:hypothetical protein